MSPGKKALLETVSFFVAIPVLFIVFTTTLTILQAEGMLPAFMDPRQQHRPISSPQPTKHDREG